MKPTYNYQSPEARKAEMAVLNKEFKQYGITARKYMGDDRYSWAVFVNGRPTVTGLSQSSVLSYKKQVLEVLKRKQNEVSESAGVSKLRKMIAKRRKKSQADQFRIKEVHLPTFIDYLLVELQLTDQDLRDPDKRNEMMRLMRSGDQQAQQIVQRAERKQIRDQRTALQQEEDPRKAAMRRKRMGLMKQVNKIDQELSAQTLQQQRQAQDQTQSKL